MQKECNDEKNHVPEFRVHALAFPIAFALCEMASLMTSVDSSENPGIANSRIPRVPVSHDFDASYPPERRYRK